MATQEKPMLSFHGAPAIKKKYLARVRKHKRLDNLIQGKGWENGRGCAIGCTLENYDPSRFPIELGLPEWLARLEDHIFEALPKEDAKEWPEQFLKAIKPGVPESALAVVRDTFQIFWLERQISQIDNEKYPEVVAAITQTIGLLHRAVGGDEPESAAWSAAWSAAESAARSAAEFAARSAAWSAAESAARSEAQAKRDWLLAALSAL